MDDGVKEGLLEGDESLPAPTRHQPPLDYELLTW